MVPGDAAWPKEASWGSAACSGDTCIQHTSHWSGDTCTGIHLTRERNLGHVALPGSETSLEAAQPACRPSVFEDSVPQVATRRTERTKAWGRAAALASLAAAPTPPVTAAPCRAAAPEHPWVRAAIEALEKRRKFEEEEGTEVYWGVMEESQMPSFEAFPSK